MDCTDCKKYVSAFLDGELDEHLTEEFKLHLQTCHECRLLLNAERRVMELLKNSYHPEKAPFSFRALMRQEIDKKKKKIGFWGLISARPITGLVSAFAVLVILFLSVQVFLTNDRETDLSKVEMAGHIECISCYLAEHEHIKSYCDHYGHEMGFVSASNEIFSFFPNEVSNELKSKMEYIHSEAKLTGWIFHQANFIEVENYQIIGQAVASKLSDYNVQN